MSLSDLDRQAYEQYILGKNQDEKDQAIKKLIPGSNLYYHLYFLDKFKQFGSKLTEDDLKILKQFCQKYPEDELLTKIQVRHKLLKYDDASNEGERQTILEELRTQYMPEFSFNHTQPEQNYPSGGGFNVNDFSNDGEDCFIEEEEEQCEDDDIGSLEQQDQRPMRGRRGVNQIAEPSKLEEFDYQKFFGKDMILELIKPKEQDFTYSSRQCLQLLPTGYEHDIDFNQYDPSVIYEFATGFGSQRVSEISNQTFFESLQKNFVEEYKPKQGIYGQTSSSFTLNQQLCNVMTIEQLDKLGTLHPNIKNDRNFIGSYFQKMFNEELSEENQEVWTTEEKMSNVERLYQFAKSKDMPKALQSSLLIEILEHGIKLGKYNEDLFKDFLKMPITVSQTQNMKSKVGYQDTHWNQYIGNVQSQTRKEGKWEDSQKELVKKYLEHFCFQRGNLDAYQNDFQPNYLKEIEEKVSIYNSTDMTELKVNLKKYQEISQEVILRFLEHNKELFLVEEDIKLSLELKNIQTLYVKIFEFNTETYYKKTLQPFNTGVNLDGLITSNERKFEYSHPPNKKFIETYTFNDLNGKPGLYIVEFIGNGMSARAIVKKGSLSLIHKPTVSGHLAYILDENKKICTGPKTGLWFDGEYYPVQPNSNGKIFIPYGKQEKTSKTILINNGFAQLSEFNRLREDYEFSAIAFVNPESILVGNNAQILIRPILKVNQRRANVELLKNTKITLTTISYIDNSPVSKIFDKIKFKNDKDHILEFQVPPYVQSISIQIHSELVNVTKQTTENFSYSQNFNIKTHSGDHLISELYLRKEKGSYYFHLLGKNGEPKDNVKVQVRVVHQKYMKIQKNSIQTITTDAQGKVKLGHLKNCAMLNGNVPTYGINQNWILCNESEKLTYPKNIDAIENEILEFPVLINKISKKKLSFLRLNKGVVLEDLLDKIKLEKLENSFYNKIFLPNLAIGQYRLQLKQENLTIEINVHSGSYWENDSFILKKSCLFENMQAQKPIKIKHIQVEESKEGGNNVKIQLEDFTKDSRVHIIATQFIPNKLKDLTRRDFNKIVFPFAVWNNIFLSNRELSDEYRYVFDRKYADRSLGNTLERPKLVLKRQFLASTTFDVQQLNEGTDYAQIALQESQMIQPLNKVQKQNIQPMFREQKIASSAYLQQQVIQSGNFSLDTMCQNVAPTSYMMNMQQQMNYGEDINLDRIEQIMHESNIIEFQNFLKNKPLLEFNLIPSGNGVVEFNSNLANFSQLVVLAVDFSSVAQKTVDLDVSEIEKRNLSLNKPLDCQKGFTETRTSVILNTDSTHSIEDITSTEIQIIDDLSKVRDILSELIRNQGYSHKTFNDLSFVMGWEELTKEEKNKKYSLFSCHELNTFIYFRDQPYFQEIVKPYLQNKMEKAFVDHYLLGNFDQILHYSQEPYVLVKLNKQPIAVKLVEYIKMRKEINDPKNIHEFNRVFDIVLNLNTLKDSSHGLLNESSASSLEQFEGSQIHTNLLVAPSQPSNLFGGRANRRQALNQNLFDDEYSDGDDSCGEEQRYRPQAKKKYGGKIRQQVKMVYQDLEQTNEYMETHYYKCLNFIDNSSLFNFNEFWYDFSRHMLNRTSDSQFLSANFVKNFMNDKGSFFTLVFLDLPVKSKKHQFQTNEGRGLTIKTANNAIMFKKEVREIELQMKNDIMVTHRYIELQKQYEDTDESIPNEFLINTAYICEVIMTNVSPRQKECSILYQIPEGSLPLERTKYMKATSITLAPYNTQKIIFYFYFPTEGTFTHFPSNVEMNEHIVARSAKNELKVVKKYAILKKETFDDIIQGGSKEDILEFMKIHNLLNYEKRFNFNSILFLLKDKDFYSKVISLLRDRLIYNREVWSYSLYHKDDEQTLREFLMRENPYQLFRSIGSYYQGRLYQTQPQDDHKKHLDYFPMINARAHNIGGREPQWSLNVNFRQTYDKYLLQLIEQKILSQCDKMILVYYLLLQERKQDAMAIFKQVDLKSQFKDDTLQMQYDYLCAYFDFFGESSEGYKVARTLVRKYEDYPVTSWRLMFLEILEQLNEFDGEQDEFQEYNAENLSEEQKRINYKKSKKREPQLNVEVSSTGKIQIDSINVKDIIAKFYLIDVEILFSRTPFLKENTEEFSYVKPCHIIEKTIFRPEEKPEGPVNHQHNFDIDIPQELKNQNMVIEINGENKQIFRTYYSTQIKVQLNEAYGELKVTDKEGKVLPKVYVKVFYQKRGESATSAKFFKDGYTDIRGKFEYSQASGNKVNQVQKFAILILSDTLGSIIKECDPPKGAATASSGTDVVISQAKVERLFNKHAMWKQKR